jgi:hypothetical protein
MITMAAFHEMSAELLQDYLRERFYERSVDPPISRRHDEALEAFPISAFRTGDDDFKARFHKAIQVLLVEWNDRRLAPVPEAEDAYFGRLAFVAFTVQPPQPEVYAILKMQAETGRVAGDSERFSEQTEWHLIAALAYLQHPDALDRFWRAAWNRLPARFWGPVYDGMRRASPDVALTFVPAAVNRWRKVGRIFHPGPVWARLLVHISDGPKRLAEVAREAGSFVVTKVAQALREVEARSDLVDRYEQDADLADARGSEAFWAPLEETAPKVSPQKKPLQLVA